MAKVVPPAPRARITENGEALRVHIPAHRDFVLSAFFLAFIIPAIKSFRDGSNHRGLIDSLFVGAVAAWGVFFCFWQAKGLEEIVVGGTFFSVRYALFGVGKTWEFEPGRMRDLRVSSSYVPLSTWAAWFGKRGKNGKREWNPTGIWTGPFAFDYGAKTYHFGAGMDEAEARDILPHLLRRLSPDDPARET